MHWNAHCAGTRWGNSRTGSVPDTFSLSAAPMWPQEVMCDSWLYHLSVVNQREFQRNWKVKLFQLGCGGSWVPTVTIISTTRRLNDLQIRLASPGSARRMALIDSGRKIGFNSSGGAVPKNLPTQYSMTTYGGSKQHFAHCRSLFCCQMIPQRFPCNLRFVNSFSSAASGSRKT